MVEEDISIYCGQPSIRLSATTAPSRMTSRNPSFSNTTSALGGSLVSVQSLRPSSAQLAGTSFQEYREMATDGIDPSVPSSPSAVSSWSASSPLIPSSGSALMFLSDFQALGHSDESSLWTDFPQYDGRSGFQDSSFSVSGSNKFDEVESASPVNLSFVDRSSLSTDFNSVTIDNSSSNNGDIQLGNFNGFPAFSPFPHQNVDPLLLSQTFPNNCGSSPSRNHMDVTSDTQLPLTEAFTMTPTRALPLHGVDSSSAKQAPENKQNPGALRDTWMEDYAKFIDDNKLLKMFSKCAKDKVATINTIRASAARRKVLAKFKCPITGCTADFTRKHNLENHLKSHCGITDQMCRFCGKGFTTIPVWKRHERSCQQAKKTTGPKSFLNELTRTAK